MTRNHILSVLILLVGIPAVAGAGSFFTSSVSPCFANGGAGYRFAKGKTADYTVKIDNSAQHPDLRMQVVKDAATADFMLVDDGDDASKNACNSARSIKTIRVDAGARAPDLTIALSNEPDGAQYKIFVQSADFTAQNAAALFAVMWHTAKRRDLAARH